MNPTIYFDVEEREIGTNSPFSLKIYLDSPRPVNTVMVILDVPETLTLADFSDGNSIVNLWVEKPILKDGKIIFSGLIPNGFQGQDAMLADLRLIASQQGNISIGVNPQSKAYRNDGSATEEPITARAITLTAVGNKQNNVYSAEDDAPPERFTPQIIDLETESGAVKAVAFATQDKGVGLDSYSVREGDGGEWQIATSPHILKDQDLDSKIYVMARDKNGNEVIESVSPQISWYGQAIGYIIILAILLGLYAIVSRKNKKILS